MVDKKMYPLQAIAEIMTSAYIEASDIAMDYLQEHGVEGLDEPGEFTEEQSKELAVIGTVVWQTIAAALRAEDFDPSKDGDTFDAVMRQVQLAHFG